MGLVLLAAACSSGDDTLPGTGDPGNPVGVKLPKGAQEELDELQQELAAVSDMTPEAFADTYGVSWKSGLGYSPGDAAGLDTIQASGLGLDDDELAVLDGHGFVISDRVAFPSFIYGYTSLYAEDLPLYVSADSILHALHKSYDAILTAVERGSLIPTLDRMLVSMRARLSAGGGGELGAQARADADLYLAVAHSLLRHELQAPAASASAAQVSELFESAKAASGWRSVFLFDVARDVDFSQFEPRGHYAGDEQLEAYFRAMMWLGRIDLRILETLPDHSQVFRRRQLEAAMVLSSLMDEQARQDHTSIDETIGAFVGEHDNMVLSELDALLGDLGVTEPADLAAFADEQIAQAVLDGGYGTQRISSHIMINGLGEGTMPLSSTFLLFGQRYVVDSHVFSNVVYDRVQGGSQFRMMPDPLDVAFGALGNDHAGVLLLEQLTRFQYAPDLASMRILVDAHGQDYWQANLYNLWLGAVRTLSPAGDVADPHLVGLPAIAGTEPWGRRLLNTQLASWAELRHDTLLYAKQSYTGGASCEFPDAYVDPYPELYAKIGAFAAHGKTLLAGLDLSGSEWLQTQLGEHFDRVAAVAATLQEMAEHQRTGLPHSEEHMAFINQAVYLEEGCGTPAGVNGWYAGLFFDPLAAVELDPTVADVHTQPTDENGTPVGRVLHVGTGLPRLMVTTVDTCNGPRAYAGLASSYFEQVTENFDRLDDDRWKEQIVEETPADVGWMADLVVR